MKAKETGIAKKRVQALYGSLKKDCLAGGYNLNPDKEFTFDLLKGLLINEERYGYLACPCRLAAGNKEADLDIICPCDYRDADVDEFDMCYCALYVSDSVVKGKKELTGSIPERRPVEELRKKAGKKKMEKSRDSLSHPVWRCRVCGYLCARDEAPGVCPICKAPQERFERFM
jgi:ferredoxin-thioredoxin reductase catalytic subunit